LPGSLFVQLLGFLFLLAGTLVLLDSFARFALQGIGTPAPVLPTRHLVVTGLYRYVRNPMYVGVVSAVLGQSMILENLVLLGYAGLVWFISHLFVVTYEEPALRRTFGDWIPRLRAWTGS
jgi:protein-S-isoprenylcysteine O-methyltransferase Ste14